MAAERRRRRAARQSPNLPSRQYRVLLKELVPTNQSVSKVMRGNKAGKTGPELRVRSLLHRAGLRFRVSLWLEVEGLRTRPDLTFPSQKLVVYIDGCFWHCCPQHGNAPRANQAYWAPKLEDNVQRDRRISAALRRSDWRVLRFWEHEDPEDIAVDILRQISGNS